MPGPGARPRFWQGMMNHGFPSSTRAGSALCCAGSPAFTAPFYGWQNNLSWHLRHPPILPCQRRGLATGAQEKRFQKDVGAIHESPLQAGPGRAIPYYSHAESLGFIQVFLKCRGGPPWPPARRATTGGCPYDLIGALSRCVSLINRRIYSTAGPTRASVSGERSR